MTTEIMMMMMITTTTNDSLRSRKMEERPEPFSPLVHGIVVVDTTRSHAPHSRRHCSPSRAPSRIIAWGIVIAPTPPISFAMTIATLDETTKTAAAATRARTWWR
jgi:hypothetical protein